MPYGLVALATAMFSVQFFFKNMFRSQYGGGIRATLLFSVGSGTVGFIIMLIMNGFTFEITPFSLIMALVVFLNNLGFSFCSFKALGKINLSLYSLFSMLGGMVLPFIAGILFYGEDLTPGKIVCFALITAALLLTVKRGEKKNGFIYYVGIFVLNGMSGVLSKIFKSAPFEKTSDAGYSILCALVSIILSFVLLMILRPEKKRLGAKSIVAMAGCGVLGKVANYILLITLTSLPASAQYPFVTGGTMIMSTLLCYFTPNKPKAREIIAVALSFIGLLSLMLIK